MINYFTACILGWWCYKTIYSCMYATCDPWPCQAKREPDCAIMQALYYGPAPERQFFELPLMLSEGSSMFARCSGYEASSWSTDLFRSYSTLCHGTMDYGYYTYRRCDPVIENALEDARTENQWKDVHY
jgi:hypothetical protein